MAQATAPILDSTIAALADAAGMSVVGESGHRIRGASVGQPIEICLGPCQDQPDLDVRPAPATGGTQGQPTAAQQGTGDPPGPTSPIEPTATECGAANFTVTRSL